MTLLTQNTLMSVSLVLLVICLVVGSIVFIAQCRNVIRSDKKMRQFIVVNNKTIVPPGELLDIQRHLNKRQFVKNQDLDSAELSIIIPTVNRLEKRMQAGASISEEKGINLKDIVKNASTVAGAFCSNLEKSLDGVTVKPYHFKVTYELKEGDEGAVVELHVSTVNQEPISSARFPINKLHSIASTWA